MNRFRRVRLSTRLILAVLLALCLGVRLLTPAGFMPSFADGALTIIPCPDAAGAPPPAAVRHMDGMAMGGMAIPASVHDHDRSKDGFHHPSCPYASAASLVGIDLGIASLIVVILKATLPAPSRALARFRRCATRDRPPSRGPPFPT